LPNVKNATSYFENGLKTGFEQSQFEQFTISQPVKYIFVDDFANKGCNNLIKPITLQGIVSVMIHLRKQKQHFCKLNM